MTEQKFFEENKNFSIPEVIPLLPLHNVLVSPKMLIPLEVAGSNSIQLSRKARTTSTNWRICKVLAPAWLSSKWPRRRTAGRKCCCRESAGIR